VSQRPHSARVEALLAAGRAELASPTPGVEAAPEHPTVPRGDATAADPRRAVLDRIAREVMATKQYTAPAVLAMDLIDAILAAGIRTRRYRPEHRCPPHQFLKPGFYVGYIAELDDDSEGPQLMGFSDEVFATEEDARAEHADAEEWRPGWRVYQLTEVTEGAAGE